MTLREDLKLFVLAVQTCSGKHPDIETRHFKTMAEKAIGSN